MSVATVDHEPHRDRFFLLNDHNWARTLWFHMEANCHHMIFAWNIASRPCALTVLNNKINMHNIYNTCLIIFIVYFHVLIFHGFSYNLENLLPLKIFIFMVASYPYIAWKWKHDTVYQAHRACLTIACIHLIIVHRSYMRNFYLKKLKHILKRLVQYSGP